MLARMLGRGRVLSDRRMPMPAWIFWSVMRDMRFRILWAYVPAVSLKLYHLRWRHDRDR